MKYLQSLTLLILGASAIDTEQARGHSHSRHGHHNVASPDHNLVYDQESLETMSTQQLISNLQNNLSLALESESNGDKDAAVAKTAAIKNIQKALTARILKRLDDGQPLVEVARKMKAIEGM